MDLPDNYTDAVADCHRFFHIVNGFHADVMAWILPFIPKKSFELHVALASRGRTFAMEGPHGRAGRRAGRAGGGRAGGGEPKGTEGAPRVACREVLGSAWDEWFRVDSSST